MPTIRGARALRRLVGAGARRTADAWAARHERLMTQDYEGLTLCYPSRSSVGADLAGGIGWTSSVREVVAALDTTSPFVVDVGSNVGTSLLQFKLAAPGARVLCLEGSPRFLPALRATVAANGWRDVEVVATLVGEKTGSAVIHSSTGTASVAARLYGGHRPVRQDTAPVGRLDDILRGRPRPTLIKSDTDGFEADVLLGGQAILEQAWPVLYFEFAPFLLAQAGRDHELVPSLLAGLGYDVFVVLAGTGGVLSVEDEPRRVSEIAVARQYVDVVALTPREEHTALRRWAGIA